MDVVKAGGFEWNDATSTTNLRDHGVSFEQAAEACDDALALVLADPVDPDRSNIIGMDAAKVLCVVTIEKAETIRIIGARRATPAERRAYEEG